MAQWNKKTQDFLDQERSLFEVVNIADHWGEQTDWRPSFTPKNRLKVSDSSLEFFNTFQYGIETDVWDQSITGIGSATFNINTSSVTLSVGVTTGSKVIRQTKQVMKYIPGRSSKLSFGIRLDTPESGIRRRLGLFDEYNGAYFEDDGGTYSCVIRSTTSGITTERRVTRDNWNGDKLDGNGPSQIIASPTAQHLINIDYDWYGAGQVKFNFVIDGENHTIHKFNNANNINSVWCGSPFLPIRLELENITGVAGTHYLYQGSNSLIQEGRSQRLGTAVAQANPITGTTMPVANTFYPILSIRLKPNMLSGVVIPRSLQIATNDNTNVFWRLIENAGIVGAAWTNHSNPDAFTQYDTTATSYTDGRILLSGFVIGGGGGNLVYIDDTAHLQLGRSGIGTISDTYTIVCASPNANKSALAVLNWLEQR